MENWKSIAGYEGFYEISNFGRVRSLWHGKEKILKPRKHRDGYLRVDLCKDRIQKTICVHRLVAEAFIPNPLNLETVNHSDEDKTNNNVSNLEWMSQADNHNYGTHNKRVAEANVNNQNRSKRVQMLDRQENPLETFQSIAEAERVTGIYHGSISACCNRRLKSAGGYVWRYA